MKKRGVIVLFSHHTWEANKKTFQCGYNSFEKKFGKMVQHYNNVPIWTTYVPIRSLYDEFKLKSNSIGMMRLLIS